MNYRFPFETALTSNEQAFRSQDHPALQALAQRIQIVREIVAQNIKDARANMERLRIVGTQSHTFQGGDRVFISSQLDQNRALNAKHARKFAGPYVIREVRGDLARIAQVYTGRQLSSYINVDKLRLLRDVGRDVLYNRYLTDSVNDDNGQVSIPEKRTIQCIRRPLNYGRPLTENINALPLVAPETAKRVFTQPHKDDMFYDKIKQDSRSSPQKAGDAREPLQSWSSDSIITQPSTQLNVSEAHSPYSQDTAEAHAESHKKLVKNNSVHIERVVATDPLRSSRSHATVDLATSQPNDPLAD
jgi:hypothetical protein